MGALQPELIITEYTHFFKVELRGPGLVNMMNNFTRRYTYYGFQRGQEVDESQVKIFAEVCLNCVYRYHKGILEDFKRYLEEKYITEDRYQVIEEPLYTAADLKANIKDGWELKDKQPEAVSFAVASSPVDHNSRMITMPTGTGKTVCAAFALAEIKQRFMVLVLPGYLDKWEGDLLGLLTIKHKRIAIVKGTGPLQSLIELTKRKEIDFDAVCMSLTTMRLYFDMARETPNKTVEEYGCMPEDLYKLLGIGVVLIDEAHEHLHAVYRAMCYMHVPKVIALSATFLSPEPFLDNIQKVMFPMEIRFDDIKMKKYIEAYGIAYTMSNESKSKIKWTNRGSPMYSNIAFEKSILKNKSIYNHYVELLDEVLTNGYLEEYKPGKKAIVFCSTIDMCNKLCQTFKQKYPELDTRTYVGTDPYKNAIEPDIRFTTQQSAGTAIDIKGLVTNVSLNNMKSPVAGLQALGRLREPEEGTARYFSVYCEDIPKQKQFHNERKKLFKDRVVFFKEYYSNVSL